MGYSLALRSYFTASAPKLNIVYAVTVVSLPDGSSFLLVVYNSLLDHYLTQTESMLLLYHARDSRVIINDIPPHHSHCDGSKGTQATNIGNITLPFHNDKIMYWTIHQPTPDKLDNLPILELTSIKMPNHYAKGGFTLLGKVRGTK